MLLTIAGNISDVESIACANFSSANSPGVYSMSYMLMYEELLSVYMPLQSIAVAGALVDVGAYVDYTVYDGNLTLPNISLSSEAGQPIVLQLASRTNDLAVSNTWADGWLVSMSTPGNSTAAELGPMLPAGIDGNVSFWDFTVSSSGLTQVSWLVTWL